MSKEARLKLLSKKGELGNLITRQIREGASREKINATKAEIEMIMLKLSKVQQGNKIKKTAEIVKPDDNRTINYVITPEYLNSVTGDYIVHVENGVNGCTLELEMHISEEVILKECKFISEADALIEDIARETKDNEIEWGYNKI